MNAEQMERYAIRGATRYLKLRHALLNPDDPAVRAATAPTPERDTPPTATEAEFDKRVDALPEPPR